MSDLRAVRAPFVHDPKSPHAEDGRAIAWDLLLEVAVDRTRSASEVAADLARDFADARASLSDVAFNSFVCAALTTLLQNRSIEPP